MLLFLLRRPIALLATLACLLIASTLALFKLPVSLLPSIDIPKIIIQTHLPLQSAEEIEKNVLKPIREMMVTVPGAKNLESNAQESFGKVIVMFEHGVDMSLAYIEVNERIDKLSSLLPRSYERPIVMKASTSDLPTIKIQVIPLNGVDQVETSELTTRVIRRRVEQIPGVGMVDLNGITETSIQITPYEKYLMNFGLTNNDIINSIRDANLNIGSLALRDGNYQFFLKLQPSIEEMGELKKLPILLPNGLGSISLEQVASVSQVITQKSGFHLFMGAEGLVINVLKLDEARMPQLMRDLNLLVEEFRKDYPQLHFQITQDQSRLLDLSISNLNQSLIWGGLFAFVVLFIFMHGWREPLIMGIVLPISLILSFSIFYLFNISLNIISLSGLALGLGMLVDNSIVVIDSIIKMRSTGNDLLTSCADGTHEVLVPLISSSLTNLVVFLPLIFLDGLTGALFYDQAIAVFSILSVSLLCTFILIPMLFFLLFKNRKNLLITQDSRLFRNLKNFHLKVFDFVWNNKIMSVIFMSCFAVISVFMIIYLPRQGFPAIEKTESLVSIDWNEPLSIEENNRRIKHLFEGYSTSVGSWEGDVGLEQFLLSSNNQSSQQSNIYIQFPSQTKKEINDRLILKQLSNQYPRCRVVIKDPPNAFEQLFSTNQPYLEARFRKAESNHPLGLAEREVLLNEISYKGLYTVGPGFETNPTLMVKFEQGKMINYGITQEELIQQMKIAFGDYLIDDLTMVGESVPVRMKGPIVNLNQVLKETTVRSKNGNLFPLSNFISTQSTPTYKNYTADSWGIYYSLLLEKGANEIAAMKDLTASAKNHGLQTTFLGEFVDTKKNATQVAIIFTISIFLMYCILAGEFESLIQPFLILISLPVALSGSFILLWITGGSLNIMSGIGLIVVLGIIDNDAILKIDRINKLKKTMPLTQAIKSASEDRFKPIVMNTCTNVLAITPMYFASGLGADLQRPIVLTTIGGLIIATITALYFIPILYWYLIPRTDLKNF